MLNNVEPPSGRNDSGPAPPRGKPGKPDHAASAAAKHLNNASLRRRREAAWRLPPLGPCSCIRDPLHDHHRCSDQISDRMVDGYKDTVLHLRHCGLFAAPNIPAMRVLWRRSADDRQLVTEIAERWEVAG